MKVLLACEFYRPSVGGVQEVMRQIAERLVERGHRVTVATSHLPERQSRNVLGVQVEEFGVSGNLVCGLAGEVDRYRKYVLEADYDVLMIKAAQQWTFDALTPVLGSIARPKVFVPCGFSGLFDPQYAGYFEKMPDWLSKFDRLVFYATDYRDVRFAREHGIGHIESIPNGADEREFLVPPEPGFRAAHGIREDAFLVLTVGSITGLKGHLELALAFERADFAGRPAVLLLNGNTPREQATWRARAAAVRKSAGALKFSIWLALQGLQRLGLGWLPVRLGYRRKHSTAEALGEVIDRINALPGRQAMVMDLPRSELIRAYFGADLFVFASNVEYSPLVLFEAAAAGLPFLSVPVGNAAEIAEWTGGGVICAAAVDGEGYTRVDPQALVEAMSRLAAQPDVLARLRAQGRQNWEARFTWDRIGRMYEQMLKACIEEASA